MSNVRKFRVEDGILYIFKGVNGMTMVIPDEGDNLIYNGDTGVTTAKVQTGSVIVHFRHTNGEETSAVFPEGDLSEICDYFDLCFETSQTLEHVHGILHERIVEADEDIKQILIYEVNKQ